MELAVLLVRLIQTHIFKSRVNFNFSDIRTTIPEREKIRSNYDRTAPMRSLTHIGCAFAVDREFFFEIGSYDDGMDIWGSENVELAFRVSSYQLEHFIEILDD